MLHRWLRARGLDGLTWADLRYDLGAGLLLTALLVPARSQPPVEHAGLPTVGTSPS